MHRKPYILFMSQITYFLFTARPVEFTAFKPLIQQKETVILLSEYSDKKIYPQVFVIRTFLWNKA